MICGCMGMWHVVCGMWHVACGMWHVACGMWHGMATGFDSTVMAMRAPLEELSRAAMHLVSMLSHDAVPMPIGRTAPPLAASGASSATETLPLVRLSVSSAQRAFAVLYAQTRRVAQALKLGVLQQRVRGMCAGERWCTGAGVAAHTMLALLTVRRVVC